MAVAPPSVEPVISAAPAIEDLLNLSGDVLYIENRAPVIRDASQTEDIKVVVTL